MIPKLGSHMPMVGIKMPKYKPKEKYGLEWWIFHFKRWMEVA